MVNQQSATTQGPRYSWTLEDKSELLLQLYGKAMECMDEALDLIDAGDVVEKGRRLMRAQDIVLQLSDALDHQGAGREMAANLEKLYLYVYRLLIRGNTQLDCAAGGEAKRLMASLYGAWELVVHGATEANFPVGRARF